MDDTASIYLKAEIFLEGGGSGHLKSGSFTVFGEEEFHFWQRSFDELLFIYDHLNGTEDVEGVKTLGS